MPHVMVVARNFMDMVAALPASKLDMLYDSAFICEAVLRSFPPLAKKYVIQMLYVSTPVPAAAIEEWVLDEYASKHKVAIDMLVQLRVFVEVRDRRKEVSYKMNVKFQDNMQKYLVSGGSLPRQPIPSSITGRLPTLTELENYALEQWECFLLQLINSSQVEKGTSFSSSMMRTFQRGLLSSRDNEAPKLSENGFQFLLMETNAQLWYIMREYISSAEERGVDPTELISFLLELSFHTLGDAYSLNSLTDVQRIAIRDLAELGLVKLQQGRKDSWFIPTKLATNLREVSHEILKKCDGLPLAIIAISGLLTNKISTRDQWDQVLKSIGGTEERNYSMKAMRSILSLSYFDLPPNLKTCLLYLSVFPKGYIIEKQDLIRRWIAEGFIYKKDRYTEHELGEKYFNELINRGLLYPEKTDKYDKVKSYQVHDMVLDFIISKSIEENFVTFPGIHGLDIVPQSKVRRLSLHDGNNDLLMRVELSHTRSLNVFGNSAEIPCLDEFLHLRVLNFRGCNQLLNHHLANISKLFLLRYLNLRDTRVSELPEEIGHLECLEMLELRGTDVRELPAAIVNLRKLVHLLTDTGVKFPDGIAKMQALEVLKHVSAFKQSFNFLQELGQLKNLRKLHLNFDGFATGDTTRVRQWMELWSPNSSSLQKLMTWNSAIPWVPNWVGFLVNLQQLRLEVEGVSQKDLCILGGLPSLLILDLIGTAKSEDRLTVNDGVGFPCLRQFCYDILDGGMDLTFAPGSMPKLEKLIIYFDAAETKSLTSDSFDFGIENLPCLTSVKLGVLGSVESAVEAAKAAMERAASTHPNHPSVCFEYISTSDDEYMSTSDDSLGQDAV